MRHDTNSMHELDCFRFELNIFWAQAQKIWPTIGKVPTLEFSRRLTRTAGYNVPENRIIVLGYKFIRFSEVFRNEMITVILRHEACHQIDCDLHGLPDNPRHWHGKLWKKIMMRMGEKPEEFHNMDLPV